MKPAGLLGAFAVMAVAWTEAIAVNPADYGHSPTGANAQIIPSVANFFVREWTKRLAEAPVGFRIET